MFSRSMYLPANIQLRPVQQRMDADMSALVEIRLELVP